MQRKIPNDMINLDRKAQAIARNSQNCSTTTLVGNWNRATQPPSFSLLAGEILILSAGFVLFSTVVFLGDLEIYFFVPVSGHWGSRKDGWTGGPGRQKGGQGRQRGGGQRACKHASHYYVHGTVAGQGELKSQKFSKATPLKMFRLTKINWFDPLTLTCMQAR